MRRCWMVLALVGAAACERATVAPEGPERAPQVSERQALSSPVRGHGLALGEACQDEDSCTDGACLHVDVTSRLAGKVCSRACGVGADCPAGWRCVQVFPSDDASFCLPEAR